MFLGPQLRIAIVCNNEEHPKHQIFKVFSSLQIIRGFVQVMNDLFFMV
jgi:hypothetical protein